MDLLLMPAATTAARRRTTWRGERVVDLFLAVSLLSWAGKWLYDFGCDPRGRGLVTLVMGLFQAWVGVLFLLRLPVDLPGSAAATLLSVPSLLCSGVALKLSGSPGGWGSGASALFTLGAVAAVVSLSFLGKSFAVLPARRPTVRRGPYQWIRHPAYLGELLMVFACALAASGRVGVWIFPIALLLLVVRIVAEEMTLGVSESYREYRTEVRWRLVPGIW